MQQRDQETSSLGLNIWESRAPPAPVKILLHLPYTKTTFVTETAKDAVGGTRSKTSFKKAEQIYRVIFCMDVY